MSMKYRDFMKPNSRYQRSVNLSLDLGNMDFIENYIPTRAGVRVLKEYLHAVLSPNGKRASVLIGPYGRGKSHVVFIAEAIVSEISDNADRLFYNLAQRVRAIDSDAADAIMLVRQKGIRLLPIIINDRYLDIKQAFLVSLRKSLANAGLSELMPDNYFHHCLVTIHRWREQYPSTYAAYETYVHMAGHTTTDFENALKQYSSKALALFRECHRFILSGAEFDPNVNKLGIQQHK